jgi:hypothetical protein
LKDNRVKVDTYTYHFPCISAAEESIANRILIDVKPSGLGKCVLKLKEVYVRRSFYKPLEKLRVQSIIMVASR